MGDGDLFLGERDEEDGFRFSFEMLLSERFLDEDLVNRLGSTIRKICLLPSSTH